MRYAGEEYHAEQETLQDVLYGDLYVQSGDAVAAVGLLVERGAYGCQHGGADADIREQHGRRPAAGEEREELVDRQRYDAEYLAHRRVAGEVDRYGRRDYG